MIDIKIYTDGACKQNIGKGGWAFLILKNDVPIFQKQEPILSTTNNQCEMLAAINGLKELSNLLLEEKFNVSLLSDSAYLVNAFLQDWISKWESNGWRNSTHEPVANKDYWLELIQLQKLYSVNFTQIKRRSDVYAKKVDELAKKASNAQI